MNQISDTNDVSIEVKIEKWKNTRFWGVWMDQELLAVVLYKKGAMAVRNAILALQQRCSG
jgi:hypothetical protein